MKSLIFIPKCQHLKTDTLGTSLRSSNFPQPFTLELEQIIIWLNLQMDQMFQLQLFTSGTEQTSNYLDYSILFRSLDQLLLNLIETSCWLALIMDFMRSREKAS